jgi:hypothetical protein
VRAGHKNKKDISCSILHLRLVWPGPQLAHRRVLLGSCKTGSATPTHALPCP